MLKKEGNAFIVQYIIVEIVAVGVLAERLRVQLRKSETLTAVERSVPLLLINTHRCSHVRLLWGTF